MMGWNFSAILFVICISVIAAVEYHFGDYGFAFFLAFLCGINVGLLIANVATELSKPWN